MIGGAPRWLNMAAAMKIGGFTDPSVIYKAIESGELRVNEKLLYNKDPTHEKSWIQIETASFLQWLEGCARLDTDRVYNGISVWSRANSIDNANIRHDLHRIHDAIKRLSFDIEALAALIFENLRVKRSHKGDRVKRRRRG